MADNSGPAFPFQPAFMGGAGGGPSGNPGMSLRDWFAGRAIIGIWQNRDSMSVAATSGTGLAAQTASWAYEVADAMLAERSK